jgi:hypothetical protein
MTGRYPLAGWLAAALVLSLAVDAAAQDAPGVNPKSLNAQLIEFAKKGEDARAMKVLDQGADANTRNRSGQTALYLFAQKGKADAVARLIEKGADVNLETLDKTTPLMAAAHGGYLAVAKLLVEHGADIQRKDQIELDAVMYAAGRGHVEVMNYLIEQGKVDVNQRLKHATTVLMWAAGYGQLGTVKALIERGADPAAKDDRGMTAADVARRQGLKEVADYLDSLPR